MVRYSKLAGKLLEEKGIEYWIKFFGWQGGTHTQVGQAIDNMLREKLLDRECKF